MEEAIIPEVTLHEASKPLPGICMLIPSFYPLVGGAEKQVQELSEQVDNETMKKTLLGFASAERGHKLKLQVAKTHDAVVSVKGNVTDLKIGDYLVAAEPVPELSFQDALLIAMKREKAAMQLYTDLAGTIGDEELKALFLALAEEESRHKLRFEAEYEEYFLSEN